MYVKKRNRRKEELNVDKINACVMRACEGIDEVSPSEIVLDAQVSLYDGVTTAEIDRALILSARSKIQQEPNYNYVASRLLLNTLYKETFGEGVDHDGFELQYRKSFIVNLRKLVKAKRINPDLLKMDLRALSAALKPERDLKFKYLGIQTLADRYLLHIDKVRMETPQGLWMRVAMGLSLKEEDPTASAIKTYELLSQLRYLPSTPTLFNSGTMHSQMSSCYLNTFDDSIDGIFEGIWQEARKAKFAGGLGFDVTNFRGTGAYIQGTNGSSQGLIPWLKIMNDTLIAVNQGGKRKGAGCAYLEVWHIDVEDFLELRKNTGDDRRRCHDMNTAAWCPDLFFRYVLEDKDWYLFSPDEVRDLHETFGEEFDSLYESYVEKAKAGELRNHRVVSSKKLWKKMLTMLFETGHPWITFKDPANIRYSNQHEGVVHSSNLCTEILLHTKPSEYSEGEKTGTGETAVCNLGSINMAAHVNDGKIDFLLLKETVRTAVRILDNVIDLNFYPTQEARNSNLRHRPIGLGCMGVVDAMRECGIYYDDEESVAFCSTLQEFISYHAIDTSCDLAQEKGAYTSFEGSLWSQGVLPVDTYMELMRYRGTEPLPFAEDPTMGTEDWDRLRDKVRSGMRNSNVMAIAPTATISFIAGCSQSIEPDYRMIYVYSTLSGDFTMVNEHFVRRAKELGLWSPKLIESLHAVDGDVSLIELPEELKKGFHTAFSVSQERLIDCAAARQIWIDQGQSLNVYCNTTSLKSINEVYMHAWKRGLKTTYYLRSLAASTVEKSVRSSSAKDESDPEEVKACSIEAVLSGSCESCQ